ncbi:MAG: nitrous oxide reductase accessory protein NosL [Thermodesulfobacteriota bacterium]
MKRASQIMKMTTSKKLLTSALLLLALALSPLANAADQPAPMAIPDNLSCGVCGMYPAKFVKWQTQIIFTDGVMVPFDGSKDMFKYILNMAKYESKHTSNDIAAIWVKGFNSGKWLDGKTAVYVVGSKVMGPMGKELIPFNNGDAAKKFKAANEGMIKQFADISMGDIKKLGMGGMKMKGKM